MATCSCHCLPSAESFTWSSRVTRLSSLRASWLRRGVEERASSVNQLLKDGSVSTLVQSSIIQTRLPHWILVVAWWVQKCFAFLVHHILSEFQRHECISSLTFLFVEVFSHPGHLQYCNHEWEFLTHMVNHISCCNISNDTGCSYMWLSAK